MLRMPMHVITTTRRAVSGIRVGPDQYPIGVEVDLSAEALAAITSTPGYAVDEAAVVSHPTHSDDSGEPSV